MGELFPFPMFQGKMPSMMMLTKDWSPESGNSVHSVQKTDGTSVWYIIFMSFMDSSCLTALFQTIKPFIHFPNLAAPPTVAEEGDEELN